MTDVAESSRVEFCGLRGCFVFVFEIRYMQTQMKQIYFGERNTTNALSRFGEYYLWIDEFANASLNSISRGIWIWIYIHTTYLLSKRQLVLCECVCVFGK